MFSDEPKSFSSDSFSAKFRKKIERLNVERVFVLKNKVTGFFAIGGYEKDGKIYGSEKNIPTVEDGVIKDTNLSEAGLNKVFEKSYSNSSEVSSTPSAKAPPTTDLAKLAVVPK